MRIKVAGTNYEIVREKLLAAGSGVYGEANFVTQQIRIDSDLTPERASQTLIHELLHAVFYESGYKDHDEEMVVRLSNVLYQVLADNDALTLMEDIAEKEAV
ncbi:ImmA/IrrE family metallo-endopeptidase [Paenibacillus dendritiformis]|uniref:ImmA/IrrE family metallo-endopeptidase n=1 Tax=Paenibacillus dendritiformis TaxID=130049 RepID=UPI00387E057A